MKRTERMYKLSNGTDTAIWAHDEIVSLREQLAQTEKQLAMEQSCYEKNAADSLDSLAECSVENETLRERLAQAQSQSVTNFVKAIKQYEVAPFSGIQLLWLHTFAIKFNQPDSNTTIDKGEL